MIHKTAIISKKAIIGSNVSIGAYSVIGDNVEIGDGTIIANHVLIEGPTKVGRDNKIFSFNAIGGDPQDKKYNNELTSLEIGDKNTIREYCTINRGNFPR